MARKVIGGLIQCANAINDDSASVATIRDAMYEKHLPLIEEAAKQGVQILCLQEVFNGPYFYPSQDSKWCDIAEEIPSAIPGSRATSVRLMSTFAAASSAVPICAMIQYIVVIPAEKKNC